MKIDQGWKLRIAVLSTLVSQAKQKPGRTALMKFAFFLQTLRRVPLGYDFQLYNYGPYDSAVLSDLSEAATLKMIKSEAVRYPSGVGYLYSTNRAHEPLCRLVAEQLSQYSDDIKWVLDKFGERTAAELELLSTIVFAEREMNRKKVEPVAAEVCRQVKQIKPHFTEEMIAEAVEELRFMQLISVS